MITTILNDLRKLKSIILRRSKSIRPASTGDAMYEFVDLISNWTKLKPQNIFEIGANLGQDAKVLQKGFNVKSNSVYIFEPHPQLINLVRKETSFKCFNYAISNNNGTLKFNAVNLNMQKNSGISSIRSHTQVNERYFNKINVESWRMDKFIKKFRIKSIDFLKLDVEGCTYEVLEGFGERLKIVKSIHIEAEHRKIWKGQKTWSKIENILSKTNFVNIYFKRYGNQSDSLWIQRKYIKS